MGRQTAQNPVGLGLRFQSSMNCGVRSLNSSSVLRKDMLLL
jgi:hypothetical protein